MILLDSDILVDLLRRHPPASRWFDSLHEDEEIAVPGYVVMELVQGCRNRAEQESATPVGRLWGCLAFAVRL